jgi:lysophospholipid acyltransferase (LPLAT)-like uncharacterized protein
VSEARGSTWSRRVRIALAAGVGGLVVRLLARTWRYRAEGRGSLDRLRAERRPLILALWHGELLPCLWLHRGEGIVVLISTHADGEIVARLVESLGYRTVRGSTSRGGARAILDLVRELEAGHEIAVTTDGPRGPRHAFAPGALAVAQRSGAPVVCGRIRVSRAWRLRSWDRFVIPKPFARVVAAYGEPQYVRAPTARDAEAEVPRFERLMATLGAPNDS